MMVRDNISKVTERVRLSLADTKSFPVAPRIKRVFGKPLHAWLALVEGVDPNLGSENLDKILHYKIILTFSHLDTNVRSQASNMRRGAYERCKQISVALRHM